MWNNKKANIKIKMINKIINLTQKAINPKKKKIKIIITIILL